VDQIQNELLVELEELVEGIFSALDELREVNQTGRLQRDLIDSIFRRVHSVKGSTASFGLDVVSEIAHEFENLLDEVRSGRVVVNDSLLDTCESAATALSESLSLAGPGAGERSHRELLNRLQAAARNRINFPGPTEAILEKLPSEIWQALTETEKQRLLSVVSEGSRLFVVATNFEETDFDAKFFKLKQKLAEFGQVISTSPAVDDKHPERINFRVLFAGDIASEVTANFSEVVFEEIETPDRVNAEAPAAPASRPNFVRADLDKLDLLISSTNELLRTTARALDLAMKQEQTNFASSELPKLNEQIRSSLMGVEHELISLRLVPIGPALQRALRAGRTAARLAGKEIDFESSGGEIRLDKLLVEAIADSLVHLVRNAVDHGIETPKERIQAGKTPRGTVRIEAVSEGSQSRVRVTDDGRGVDPARISQAAIKLGITGSGPLDTARSLRMIFRPGFTTLDSLSDLSRRGVGLDVVETSVEQVGGELRVSSNFGAGTTFEIRLPVTFGVIPTNIVVSAGHRYCIPTSQTLGIDAIDVVDGSSGANQLRQVSLRDLLGQPEEPEDSEHQLHLITCQFADEGTGSGNQKSQVIGIVVDRVEGPQEVLVRNLGRHAGRWYGIAGATELRDGTPALVLDLPRLLASQ
jgi:two-component system chemotaxis sensor kinase CheA